MNRFARNFLAFAAQLATFGTAAIVYGTEGYYRQPSISNDSVIFVAEGDLWRASLDGGTAQRLTSNLAAESNPAPLIGTTTAGAGIWLSDQNRLRDNGIARAAESGVFVQDGPGSKGEHNWITEGTGVKPDMEVDNLPHASFKGEDAQLDAAIGYLMDKMTKELLKMPVLPAFPIKAKP